ncbi:MAG: hypothetical protein QM564_04545 [Bergeyella sp.]
MKFWSVITLLVFLNFTALPSVAVLADWELPCTNIVVSEEENHTSGTFVVYEKAIPETLNILSVLKFDNARSLSKPLFGINENVHCSPYLSIFSPPPEV